MDKTLQLRILTALNDKISGPLNRIRGSAGRSGQSMRELRDRLKGLERAQRDVGEFRELSRGLQASRRELGAAQSNVSRLAGAMRAAGEPTRAMRREFDQAVATARRLKTAHDTQARTLGTVRDRLRAAGISTTNLSRDEQRLRQQVDGTSQALQRQSSALQRAGELQRRLADAKGRYQQMQHVGASTAIVGAAGYATGRRALQGMAGVIAPGLDFDASMSNVQALARLDKNSDAMRELRQQARQLGADTMFSATEAASAQGFLAMAGFNPKAILDTMPGMLDLAKASNTDLSQTADISSNILSGFNLQASEMGRVADVLVGTFTRSNTSLYMLGETMKYAAPMAAALGQDIDVVAAMSGKLADAGIQGSMGGTALRAIMNRMSAPPKAAADALDELGIKAGDAEGNLRPMPELLKELYDKTRGMGDMKVAGLLKAIAGEEAVAALQVLVGQAGSGGLQEFIRTLGASMGEAAKTAATQADNMRGDLDELSSAWEDLGIEVFEGQDATLRDLLRRLTDVVRNVGVWVKANPELVGTIVQVVAAIAALVTGFGAVALGIAATIAPFALLRYGLSVFGLRLPGVISLVGSLARLLVGPLIAGLRMVAIAAWTLAANPAFLAVAAVLAAIAGAAYLIWRNWDEWGPSILSVMDWIWNGLKAIFDYIVRDFKVAWETVKTAWDGGLTGLLELFINWSPMGVIVSAFSQVMRYLGVELPGRFTDFGKMMMQGLVNGIESLGGAVREAITGVADKVKGWFADKLGIQSPSRVFVEMGANISQGAALGISRDLPLAASAARRLAETVTVVGALAAGPALADIDTTPAATRFDTRPALTAAGPARAPITIQGDTITIQITAAPGTDPKLLANAISAELDRRERAKAARLRATYTDYDN